MLYRSLLLQYKHIYRKFYLVLNSVFINTLLTTRLTCVKWQAHCPTLAHNCTHINFNIHTNSTLLRYLFSSLIKYHSATTDPNTLKVNYRLEGTMRQEHSHTLTHICMQLVLSLLLIRIMIRCVIGRVDGHMRRVHTIGSW